ncbi:autotransporter assembly complex protein TamA [Falsiroseomonas sp.]|uniref:autotransporter assembly complex protein TamA n=1 Tax=Falsiroseomonas sp. TaxID=2870721 RepID=UPI0035615397
MRFPSRLPLLLLLSLLIAAPAATQQPTLRYQASFVPTGEQALDSALAEASQLRALAEDAPVDAYGLVARAEAEPARLEEVLHAEGYWAPRIEIRIAGEPAATPGLAARLEAASPEQVPVEVRVEPGPRYTYRRLALRAATPEGRAPVAALELPAELAPGEPARTDPVLDAEAALLDALRRAGHPLAAIADREVVVDHDAQAMDVAWTLAPGPRAAFAMPGIAGETEVSRRLISRVAGRLTGEPYSPQRLERTRRDLLALGAFDTVRVRAAERLDAAGRLPVTFSVADRPRNAAGVTLAYETNYGPSGRVYYERRNLFGNAELLRIEAGVSRIGTSGGTADVNYRLGASLRRPGLLGGRTSLVLEAAALRERLEAYDRDAIVTSAILERPIGERWLLRGGPIFETGRIGRDGNLEPFTLLGLVTGVRYDSTASLLDPRSGVRVDLSVTPYADLAEGGGFVRALGTARTYFDFTGDGGTVLALRATLGSLVGASREVPLDKRFYAGGGGSVRGYDFQGIGPRDALGRPLGGSSLVEGSVELRQRVSGNFGMVAFLDAGSVGASETPDFSDLRLGAGLGVRYATAIGPLRLDVGLPLNRQAGDTGYGIYVGLGQAF